jgi:hypothetical protein
VQTPQLPAGDWYCSCECAVLRDQIDIWVSQADVPLGATHSLQVRPAAAAAPLAALACM